MTKTNSKKALLSSAFALVLSVAMLIGTTFAWFTDTASTGINKIQAGNLDVKLMYSTDMVTWKEATDQTKLFNDNALWEPGYTQVVYLKVVNAGNLALKYETGFSGECPTLIVHNIDQPGCIVAVTSMLAKKNVNIATMQVYRSAKGQQAVMVVECDQLIPEDGIVWLAGVEGVQKVTYFPGLTA